MEVTTIEYMIADAIGQTIGSPELVGMIILILFVLLIAFSGMNFTVGLLILIPLILLLASINLLPSWLIYLAFLGMGVLVALGVRRLWGS